MLILSRVCADFYDKQRNRIFRFTRRDLGEFIDAPESIKQDPLFQMLVDDGSIKFPEDAKNKKALENDPYAGATAEGKEIKPKTASKTKSKPKAAAETKGNSELKSEGEVEIAANQQSTSSALRAPSPQGEGL